MHCKDNCRSPRENAIATITHRRPDYLGIDTNMIFPREILDNVARGFVVDGLPFQPVRDAGGPDMFGVQWVFEPTVRGSMVVPGKPMLEDISQWPERLQLPDLGRIDWESIRTRCQPLISAEKLNATMVFTGYFERLISLLDFENASMALIDEDCTEAVHSLFEQLTLYYIDLFGKLCTFCGIDMITFHDDWGHQRAPFFSEDTCREMILPYLTRIVEACHENGMLFELHCCGKVERLVPLMVEAGVDKWDGQTINDLWGLLERYGDRICITLTEKKPEATQEEADQWVCEILSHLTPDSGKNIGIPVRGLCPIVQDTLFRRSRDFYR